MESLPCCPECGAIWAEGITCRDHFNQMGYWELENPSYIPQVHHLMVLCYHLQHPSLYSPEGLRGAKQLLMDFLVRGLSTQQVRQRDRAKLDSGKRKLKIKGTPASHGAYDAPIQWVITAADVTARGVDSYCDSVKAWARSAYEALQAAGEL